jgi:hypothetical protein
MSSKSGWNPYFFLFLLIILGSVLTYSYLKDTVSNRKELLEKVGAIIEKNKNNFSCLTSYLDTFQTSHSHVLISNMPGLKRIDFQNEDSVPKLNVKLMSYNFKYQFPDCVQRSLNQMEIDRIEYFSPNNYYSIKFFLTASYDYDFYILYSPSGNFNVKNIDELKRNYSDNSKIEWFYLISGKTAILTQKK